MWPCGGVAIRNPLRIGPGATRKIHAAWAAWKSRRRRRRGARGHPHTDAQSFAHRSWATQDPTASPTCHSKWERYSEGTPPGDTQSSAHRSSGHARSPVVPPRSLPPACSRRAGGKRPSIIRSSTSEGACRTACHVAIRNPLRIGPGATRKILAAWAAWKSQRRRRRGARGHATYRCAILCASVLGDARSYCSPTCHSKWERYSHGTPPGDTQSSAHRPWGHARSPVGHRKVQGRFPPARLLHPGGKCGQRLSFLRWSSAAPAVACESGASCSPAGPAGLLPASPLHIIWPAKRAYCRLALGRANNRRTQCGRGAAPSRARCAPGPSRCRRPVPSPAARGPSPRPPGVRMGCAAREGVRIHNLDGAGRRMLHRGWVAITRFPRPMPAARPGARRPPSVAGSAGVRMEMREGRAGRIRYLGRAGRRAAPSPGRRRAAVCLHARGASARMAEVGWRGARIARQEVFRKVISRDMISLVILCQQPSPCTMEGHGDHPTASRTPRLLRTGNSVAHDGLVMHGLVAC
jgi:hypothetical protein